MPPLPLPLPKSELPGRDSFYDLRSHRELDESWEQRRQLFLQPEVEAQKLEASQQLCALTAALCQLVSWGLPFSASPHQFSLTVALSSPHMVSVAGRPLLVPEFLMFKAFISQCYSPEPLLFHSEELREKIELMQVVVWMRMAP